MSKNLRTKTKKKKNFRLRKSVRRTLGALFMISAIVVAAIPFPDAAAADASGPTTTTTSTATMDYTTEVKKDSEINKSIDLNNAASAQTQEFFAMKSVSSGSNVTWRYAKQFDFYVTNIDSRQVAVISKYNNDYGADSVLLLDTVSVDALVYVTQAEHDQIFDVQNKRQNSQTLNASELNTDTGIKFKYFFPSEYAKLEEDARRNVGASVTAYASDIQDANRRWAYFWEYIGKDGSKFGGKIVERSEAAGSVREYVPQYQAQGIEKVRVGGFDAVYALRASSAEVNVGAGYRKDDNLFVYSTKNNSYDLVGIGEKAFSEVTNGVALQLPDSLRYIGDSAFEGSFVTGITLKNVQQIGNYAFKNSQLKTVDFGTGTQKIGTEAFYNTQLTQLSIPYSITDIGEGAFANNKNLSGIVFNATNDTVIRQYAFYNCPAITAASNHLDLSSYRITSIGKGAFALSGETDSGGIRSVKLPDGISAGASLGDFLFSGRTLLEEVIMPNNLGATSQTTLYDNLFQNCYNLKKVEFPEHCQYVSFGDSLFSTITNPEFYVKGPKNDRSNATAAPRKSTWACKMSGDAYVPYVFTENGKDFYEVSDGKFLLLIDQNGVLQKGSFFDPEAAPQNVEIPGMVGNIPVSSFAAGCFDQEFLGKILKFTISDGSNLKEIGDGVFEGSSMTKLYIGDSVEKLGKNAFKNCRSLTEVVIGKNIKDIGESAFEGCNTLTQVLFMEPDNLTSFGLANIGAKAFSTGSGALTIIGAIGPDYGPFTWAMQKDNYVNPAEGIRVCYKTPAPGYEAVVQQNLKATDPMDIKSIPTTFTVILDNQNNYPTLVGYQHYEDIPAEIRTNYETNPSLLSLSDERIVNSAFEVTVPEGVKSIDAKGYFNNNSLKTSDAEGLTNSNSIAVYFSGIGEAQEKYQDYGLFAGYYGNETGDEGKREYAKGDQSELEDKGNDRIKSISLPSVVYLPDGVFDNCENLETIQIGADIDSLGALPFSKCTSLTGVSFGNEKFICNNGIVYENNTDGSKTIVEGLASRGTVVGSSTINLNNDPDLASVTSIRDAAFSYCKQITSFDLTGVSGITSIPENCFYGSDFLNTVDLPQEVRKIGDKAFATGGNYLRVIVRGREVGLGDNAFGEVSKPEERVKQPYLVSYEDTAVRADARSQGVNVDEILDETFTFKFFDETGLILLKTDFVEKGGTAEAPEDSEIPVITGKTFKGWNKSLKNIQSDDFTLAVYTGTPTGGEGTGTGGTGTGGTGTGGTGTGTGTGGTGTGGTGTGTGGTVSGNYDADGNRLYNLTVTGGNGGGKYKAGAKVTIIATGGASGTTFGYWSSSNKDIIFADQTKTTTTLTMPASDATVVANYVGQYRLEVEYGSGTGSYPAGTKVAISAVTPPTGMKFSRWTSSTTGLTIESSTSSSTTVTMPASNAKVTANYVATGTGTGGTGTGSTATTGSNNKTSIIITKPGISDTNQASAYVSGSSDGFIVKITESSEATDAALAALQNQYADMTPIKFFAMDISLYDATGTRKITDTTGLKINITIPIPDALRQYAGNNKIAAVTNGSLEPLAVKFVTMNGVPCMSFTATHFSPYTVYVDTGNLTVGTVLDSTPQTGDGIHPKWFFSIGLASISMLLFLKRDSKYKAKLS